jgi:pyruvate/2-oxoacid:ferredoxin oxidoreductase alpha subunit
VLVGDGGLVVDVADPLEVIEQVMRYFYSLGVQGAKNKAPIEDVQKCFNRALHAASIAAAYRHPKLSAVKHLEQTDSIDGISSNATPEELRAEIAKRVVAPRDAGYVDLNALPPPANKEVAIADAEGDKEDQQEGMEAVQICLEGIVR